MFNGLGNVTGLGDIVAKIGIDGAEAFKGELNTLTGKTIDFSNKGVAALGLYTAATAALFAAVAKGVGVASEFEYGMAKVNTILKLNGDQFDSLNKQVLDLSRTTPQSLDVLTQGLYDLASSGVSAADSQYAISQASKAAVAGVTSVDVAVRSGMAIVNAYGMSVQDLGKIYDLQFKAVELGVMSYEQYSSAIGNVLPSAARLKINLDELHAALATMTLGGIDAQSSATFLARAFDEITEKADKFEAAGIRIWGSDGQFVGMTSFLQQLHDRLKGLPVQEQTELFAKFELQIQSQKAISSLSNMFERYNEVLADTEKSTGAADSAFGKINETSKAQYDILKNQLNAELIKLGNTTLPMVNSVLTAIVNSGFLQFMGSVAEFAVKWAPLPKVVGLLKDEYTWLGEKVGILEEKLPLINRDYIAHKAAVEQAASGQNVFTEAADISNRAIIDLYKSQEAARKKQQEWSDAQKKYITEITPGFKQAMADINYEFANYLDTLANAGPIDENGLFGIKADESAQYLGNWKQLPDVIDRSTQSARAFNKEGKDGKYQWSEYAGYIGDLVDRLPIQNKAMKDAVGILTELATGPIDPLSLGIKGLGLVMDALGVSGEKVKLTVDQVKASLGPLGAEIDNVTKLMEGLNASFESDKISQLQNTQTILLNGITAIKNAVPKDQAEKMIAPLQAQLQAATDELNRLTSAFQLQQQFTDTSDSLKFLTDKATEFVDKFKSGDTSGIAMLLQEQINKSQELLATLDPTSQAYQDLQVQIFTASDLYDRLTGKIVAATIAINKQAQAIDGLNDLSVTLPNYKLYGEGAELLHSGGIVTAHSGSLFPNETMVKALKNEFMLRPAATVAFGSDRLAAFNTSLNPDVLKRQERPAQSMTRPQASSQPVVQIYEATPQTYAKITDRFIAGRIKYRDRKLEVGANPYA